jgi:hypothetical protein
MGHRDWASGLTSVMVVINIGCTSAPPPAPAIRAAEEHAIQIPGKYVPPEVDRARPAIRQERPSTQDVLAGLPVGRVLFACAPTMRVRAPERVEVRISGNPKENLTAGLQERGVPIEEPSKIAPVMKVVLTPDESGVFDVKSLSEEEQLTSGGGFSQWVWSVTPLQSGTHNLYLTVNVVVNVPELGTQKRQIPVLTQSVTVRADPVYSAGQFWSSNWQWFTTTLLIPIGLWLWKKRRKSTV